MIRTTCPVSIPLLILMTKKVVFRDPRFFKEPFPNDTQLLDIYKKIMSTTNFGRKVIHIDMFMPCNIWFYVGDAPDLNRYKKQGKGIVWTATVYPRESAVLHNNTVINTSPHWYSLYFEHFDYQYQDVDPVKDFNCFINRTDVNRQSWLYLLLRRNLFDQGFVSYNMDVTRLNNYNPALSGAEVFEQQYQSHMTNFEAEHNIAKSLVPYRNFDPNKDLADIILQSRVSLILETYFYNNDEITFTEKTFRSLILPRPWLLFCSKHAVATLRTWGFDTLDDLVDHDRYDNVDNVIQRQTMILDMLQEILNFDVIANRSRLQQAASHNLNLIKQWHQDLEMIAEQDTKKLLDKVYDLYGGN